MPGRREIGLEYGMILVRITIAWGPLVSIVKRKG
jgi:hypothetical protein